MKMVHKRISDSKVIFALSLLPLSLTAWMHFSDVWKDHSLEQEQDLTLSLLLGATIFSLFWLWFIFAEKSLKRIKKIKRYGFILEVVLVGIVSFYLLQVGSYILGLIMWVIPLQVFFCKSRVEQVAGGDATR